MSTSLATTMQQILDARVKLAAWLGEHGQESTEFVPLVEVLDQLDGALKPRAES